MTADILDASQEIEQHILDARINSIRQTGRLITPNGTCRWCKEIFETGSEKLFCDSDCSEDYEKFNRQR